MVLKKLFYHFLIIITVVAVTLTSLLLHVTVTTKKHTYGCNFFIEIPKSAVYLDLWWLNQLFSIFSKCDFLWKHNSSTKKKICTSWNIWQIILLSQNMLSVNYSKHLKIFERLRLSTPICFFAPHVIFHYFVTVIFTVWLESIYRWQWILGVN